MKRRKFLQSVTGAAATSLLVNLPRLSAQSAGEIRIVEPFSGAILHERFGEPVLGVGRDSDGAKTLAVRVSGIAPTGKEVFVVLGADRSADQRKVVARRKGETFEAVVNVTDEKNIVQACYREGDRLVASDPARFVWLRNSIPRCRFQIDDNSFFLRDIHQNDYRSLFDSFYLAGLRNLHQKYETKFVLNTFNSTPERDFEMKMMSEKYRSEWADNADWLRLSFHAENEFPNRPYENDPPEILARDYSQVEEQIKRFAGETTWTPPGIIHFAEVRPNAFKTLARLGVRSLSGYFVRRGDSYPTSFHLSNEICAYLSENDGWFDFENGIVFNRLEAVFNLVPLPDVIPLLEKSVARPQTAEVMDFLTHEQYFWPFYKNYLPDHFDRLDAALRFVHERGYRPVFHSDGFFSVPADDEIREV